MEVAGAAPDVRLACLGLGRGAQQRNGGKELEELGGKPSWRSARPATSFSIGPRMDLQHITSFCLTWNNVQIWRFLFWGETKKKLPEQDKKPEAPWSLLSFRQRMKTLLSWECFNSAPQNDFIFYLLSRLYFSFNVYFLGCLIYYFILIYMLLQLPPC